MFSSGRQCRACAAGWILLVAVLMGTAIAAVLMPEDPAQLLKQADSLKTSDHSEFVQLMKRIGGEAATLSPQQRMYLHPITDTPQRLPFRMARRGGTGRCRS